MRLSCKNELQKLLDSCCKILTQCLRSRLNKSAVTNVNEYHSRFKYNSSLSDQIFTLKEIQTNCYNTLIIETESNNKGVYPREYPKLYILHKNDCKKRSKLVSKGYKPNEFEVKRGLEESDPVLPVLFNLMLKLIIRKNNVRTKETMYKN